MCSHFAILMCMTNEELRAEINAWLKEKGITRQELSTEAGYNKTYLNNLMSYKPISERTEQIIRAAMQRIEERAQDDLSEITVNLSDRDIEEIYKTAEELKMSIDAFVNMLIKKANKVRPAAKDLKEVSTFAELPVVETSKEERYNLPIIGNIAAGGLQPGDTIPYYVRANRPLGKNEYVLRVEGKSMEPTIKDGALVIMRKHTIPPIPKPGTIVEYYDERGVTLKKLARKKNPETGKMDYVLHPLNPAFGDIEPMDGGKISGLYVETLSNWEKT